MAVSAGSSADRIVGDGHLSASLDPLHQQPAHPWLLLLWLVGRETEAGMHVAGDTLYHGLGSQEGLERTVDAGI